MNKKYKWQGLALVAHSRRFENKEKCETETDRAHTYTEKEITEAPLMAVPIDHREWANTCLLNLTLNKESVSHSLQFVSKYHVFLDSLRAQIRDHTHRNWGPAALYCTGVELENL